MPTNWPPPIPWPPLELTDGEFTAANLKVFIKVLLEEGFTHEAPTQAERNHYFKDARCDHGHQVVGRMLISPSAVRYPIALCRGASHKDVLVLWSPYYMGAGSRNYEFVG